MLLKSTLCLTIFSVLFIISGCTQLAVKIPSKDLDIKYIYTAFQEKYLEYESPEGHHLTFKSESDPLVQTMATIESLSGMITAMQEKQMELENQRKMREDELDRQREELEILKLQILQNNGK